MELLAILQGILAGIAIAFPKGPAGLLVINQTVKFGFEKGFNVAKGPMTTTFISSIIVLLLHVCGVNLENIKELRHDLNVHVVVGFFLIGIGLYLIFFLEEKPFTRKKLLIYTFFEPLLFPATIVTFGIVSKNILTETIPIKIMFFLGIIVGTIFFYICACRFYEWLAKKGLKKIIRFIIVFFGIIFILAGFLMVLIAVHEAILIFWGLFFLFDFVCKIG